MNRHYLLTLIAKFIVPIAVASSAALLWTLPFTDSLPLHRHLYTATGVHHAERITDGVLATDGESWNAPAAAIAPNPTVVEYVLDEPTAIWGCALQADHNDTFFVKTSLDGIAYETLFTLGPVSKSGLRTRWGLRQQAIDVKYVRIESAHGAYGDEVTSISEFRLLTGTDVRDRGEIVSESLDRQVQKSAIYLLLCGVFLVLVAPRVWGPFRRVIVVSPVVSSVVHLAIAMYSAWPIDSDTVAFLRMTAALGGIVAAVQICRAARVTGFSRWCNVGLLSIWAIIAVSCYVNLGNPQFFDAGQNRPQFIHNVDMMVYFPLAKYPKELRYTGIYAAHVAAAVENDPAITFDTLKNTVIRDLRDHRLKPIERMMPHFEAVKNRFSVDRWRAFKADSRYFQQSLGADLFFRNMCDHGGNATPVWLLVARGIFLDRPATDSLLFIGAMIDFVLLAILAIAITRTFGLHAALFALIVFGANDFYMGGTSWAGASLRLDWMVALGLSICALKQHRFVVGGGLLMLATLLRAFPGALFIPFAATFLVFVVWRIWQRKKSDVWGLLLNRPTIRMALGSVVTLVVAVVVTSGVFGSNIWQFWIEKIGLLNADSHVNNVSLKAIVAYSNSGSLAHITSVQTGVDWQRAALETFQSRHLLYLLLGGAASLLVFAATLFRRPWEVALLGIMLIPLWFDPANYYHHVVFLLVLLAFRRHHRHNCLKDRFDITILLSLLSLCVLQYFTTQRTHLDAHFLDSSVLLLTTYGIITAVYLRKWPAVCRRFFNLGHPFF